MQFTLEDYERPPLSGNSCGEHRNPVMSSHIRKGSWEAKFPWRYLDTKPLPWPQAEDMRLW